MPRASFDRVNVGPVTLYHGDSLDVLPTLRGEFAAIITDPPYASGGRTLTELQKPPADKYAQNGKDLGRPTFSNDGLSNRAWTNWCRLWLGLAHPLIKHGGYALQFTDWRQLANTTDALQMGGFDFRGVVVWDKGGSARPPHTGYFRHQCEFVVWGSRGKPSGPGPFPGCYHFPTLQADKHHLTGKPTPLMQQLVRVADPGESILDPFGGSGTTAVAAALEGRRCVLIEKEKSYFSIAVARVRAAVRQAASAR